MKPVLIHLRPMVSATGARVDVRVADGASAEVFGASGIAWEPAIVGRPQLSIELFTGEMDGKMQAGRAQFTLALNAVTAQPRASALYWGGAEVAIWDNDSPASTTPAFRGHITAGTPDRETGRLQITAEVSGAVLIDKPLLTLTFGGGGGADGDGGKRGVFKPAGFGIVKNIEPVWVDQARNIGMVDGYGNTVSIGWLGEGRSSFGASVGNYASYAALAAAIDAKAVPPGRWATCIAEGMVGLGAPPNGVITVDAVFGVNRVGALMQRILTVHAALGVDRIDVPAFIALDAAVNRPIHYWTADQRNIRELVEAIARSANASPLLTFGGKFSITRVVGGAPVLELDLTGGTSPRVLNVRNASVEAPAYRLAARASRPARVLSYDEINYEDSFDDTNGLYKVGEVYRAGDLVWISNGAKFLYIAGTPAAGHPLPTATYPPAPPAANAFWQQLLPPTTANWSSIVDDNGNKPADNADVTGENTAGGIVGQGPGATANSLAQLNATDAANLATVISAVGSIVSDSVIATSEKMALIQARSQLNALWLEQNGTSLALNTTYGGDPTATQRGTAGAAVSALINYLESLTPGWADPAVNTPVDGPYLRGLFSAATTAVAELAQANGYQLSVRSTWSGVAGSGKPANNADVTAANTAAGIAGQGWGATADQKSLDNSYVQTINITGWGATVSGNSMMRASGHGDYTAAAYTGLISGPCFVSVRVNANAWHMVSFDVDLAGKDLSQMKAAVQYHPTASGGTCALFVDGVLIGGSAVGVGNATGADLTLVYDGSFFRVFLGGAQIRTSNAAANLSLYPVWHAYDSGVRYWNLKAGPGRSAARIGVNTYDNSGGLRNSSDLVTIEGTSAGFLDQGPGATASGADVLNFRTSGNITTIARPEGGALAVDVYVVTGALQIKLPLSWSDTMIRFAVDIFDYAAGAMQTYMVAGYHYDAANRLWYNCSAQMIGGSGRSKPVRFGFDASGSACIWIGNTDSAWSHLQATVRDFQAGYINIASSSWKAGWVLSLVTTLGTVRVSEARPVAGDMVFGHNAYESWGGPSATKANFKTIEGTAAALTGQGTGATANNLSQLNATEGGKLTGIEGAADVTSAVTGVAEVIISADHTGAPLTGQLPKGVAYRLIRQGADVTAAATWSRTVVSGTITCTMGSSTGALSATAISTDAVVRVIAVYGSTTRVLDVKVTRNLAVPPSTGSGGGGTAAYVSDLNSISSTSMAAITPELTVTVGAAGNVDVAASANYDFQPGFGSSYMDVLIVWQRWNGSAWVDLHGEAGGSPAYREGGSVPSPSDSPGYVSFSMTVSGLTAASSQKFRLRARGSTSDNTWFFNASASAQG